MNVFVGLMAFDEGLNEVAQALDEAVAHLLPTNPNQVPIQQEPAQDPLPYLIYNSESEPTVILSWTPGSPGEKSRTSPLSSSEKQ